jgi:tol-pal system protein YbgF
MRGLDKKSVLFLTLSALGSSACVLDRTGQSAATLYRTEMGDQRVRMSNVEGQFDALDSRVGQIEEYNRSRGQSEIRKMENLDELREELALLRGEFEVLVFQFDQSRLQDMGQSADTEFRLMWLENRASSLEKALGMKKPAAPGASTDPGSTVSPMDPTDTDGTGESSGAEENSPATDEELIEPGPETSGEDSEEAAPEEGEDTQEGSASTSEDTAAETGADDEESTKIDPKTLIQLAETHLKQGRESDARAALDRYLELYPDHADVPRALYRHAESYFNEEEYNLAANGFKSVVDRYRESKWAPYALLRQGECFEALGRSEDAEAFYRAVIQLWPTGRAAREAKSKIAALEKGR